MSTSPIGPASWPRQSKGPIAWSRLRGKLKNVFIPPSDPGERNIYLLQVMLFWSSAISAAASFNGNFAVRLGASNQLIGLMSSVPALLVVILTIPFARLIETRRRRLPWIGWSIFLHRLCYLLVALMPFVLTLYRAEAFIGLILLSNAVLGPFNAGWDTLLADTVPEHRRANIFARRNMIACSGVILAVPLMGRLLDAVPFPYGYQIVYGIGFIGAMISTWCIFQLKLPDANVSARPAAQRQPLNLQLARKLFADNEPFVRMTVNTLLLDMGAWLVSPLYIIYYLRHLGASDGWVGTLTAIANLSAVGGNYFWQRVIARRGESRVLRWMSPACGFYPLWVALTQSLPLFLVAAVINNLAMPAVNLSHYNTLLKVCPAERRPTFISIFSVVMNVGAFIAPLAGVALADRIGFIPMFVIGGTMRMLGGFMFSLWPVRAADSTTATA
jgi:MFS family permease